MKKIVAICVVLVSGIVSCIAQTINVDAGVVVKTFDHNPASINLDYLMDDDAYLKPAISLQQSFKNMKVGALRFPGGEKSDNYLWSVAPFNSVDPHFATPGACNWPNSDTRFSSNQLTPLNTTMDFDEFMTICLATGAKPLIVVAGDANYNTGCNPPTRNTLVNSAAEWVKYANIKKGYNIKNWMIGNESWNLAAYAPPSTASQYATDFIEFSKAMKAIDPTISVVANSKPGEWVNTLIQNASGYIDGIAISNYLNSNWTNGYDTYRNGNPSFVDDINSVIASIGNRNIKVIVSEYNAIDWANAWTNTNDLAHAIVNFQMFGDQIMISKVEDAFLWNTRWVENAYKPQDLNDAIDASGNLNAIGKALAIWGNNVLDKLVSSSNSGFVNSFASLDNSGNKLTLFLINKDGANHDVSVNIKNWPAVTSSNLIITQSKLSGSSLLDKFPVISTPTGTATVSGSSVNIQLNPYSINVVRLEKGGVVSFNIPSTIEAEQAELLNGAAINNDHLNYSGTGFVDNYSAVGPRTLFRVNAASAGNYDFKLYYANALANSSLSIYINGTKAKQTLLPLVGTSWDTWASSNEVLALNKGINTVEYVFDATDGGNVNLDKVLVTKSTVTGFESDNLFNAVNVYPNPFTSNIHLNKAQSWILYNAKGQELNKGTSNEIDGTPLERGVYFLKIADNKVFKLFK